MRRRRDSIFGFDFILFGATAALLVVGILFVYSSGVAVGRTVVSNEYVKQIVWAATGVGLMFSLSFLNYGRLQRLAPWIYGGLLILIVYALLFGRVVHGARSWIGLGGVGIQPSEFGKVATVLLLAAYFSRSGTKIGDLSQFAVGLAVVLLPVFLVMLQPDMGTALAYLPIFFFLGFLGGARIRHLVFLFAAGMVMVVVAVIPNYERLILSASYPAFGFLEQFSVMGWILAAAATVTVLALIGWRAFKRRYFYWLMYGSAVLVAGLAGALVMQRLIRPYQMMRFIIFLNPSVDPRGAGWNIIQSQTAVGSGGVWGKGFLMGTQSHLRYLPQQSTDFIFSILSEEWGFVGGLAVFVLFVVILLRGIRIAEVAKDEFGTLIAGGIVGVLFFHAVVNIGMAMGVMPITGIPLYFLSYGGSSTWTALISVGILQSVYMHRY